MGGEQVPVLGLPEYQTKNNKPRMVPATVVVAELFPALSAQSIGGRWFPPLGASAWYLWNNLRSDVAAMDGDISDVD